MNNYYNGLYSNEFTNMGNDINLAKKLNSQAGDNMNYNLCGFDSNVSPNELFDVYNGFIRGNMFPKLYNQYKISRPFDIKPMNEQADLLTKVDAYCFAAHDLNLYLDTHPNDKNMIRLFKELSDDFDKSVLEYESKYGPLFVGSSDGMSWSWNESPWPWENN